MQEGLGLLYTEEEISEAIDESRKVLRKYRQLKIAKKLKIPNVKSPSFSDMPRGGSGTSETALDKYLDIVSQMEQTEKCVARCELLESIILQRKYLDDIEYNQWQLANIAGYSIRQYHSYLNRAYLQFATAYGII